MVMLRNLQTTGMVALDIEGAGLRFIRVERAAGGPSIS